MNIKKILAWCIVGPILLVLLALVIWAWKAVLMVVGFFTVFSVVFWAFEEIFP